MFRHPSVYSPLLDRHLFEMEAFVFYGEARPPLDETLLVGGKSIAKSIAKFRGICSPHMPVIGCNLAFVYMYVT